MSPIHKYSEHSDVPSSCTAQLVKKHFLAVGPGLLQPYAQWQTSRQASPQVWPYLYYGL